MAIGTAVAVGLYSAYSSYSGQQANLEASKQHNKYVVENMVDQYKQISKTEADTLEASMKSGLENQKQYLKAKSQMELQAGASGMAGGSVDMLLGDLSRDFGQNQGQIIENRRKQFDDFNAQATAVRKGSHAQMKSLVKPSATQSIMTGVKDGLMTYFTMGSMSAAMKGAQAAGAAGAAKSTASVGAGV